MHQANAPTNNTNNRDYRLGNIDMVRGLAIVIMAIDHVRNYFMINGAQDPMGDPNASAALYLTRFITHFCAPVFVLFAGTSAGLMAARKTPQELGLFLFKRGLWLLRAEGQVSLFAYLPHIDKTIITHQMNNQTLISTGTLS